MYQDFYNKLKIALNNNLPGTEAQFKMASELRNFDFPTNNEKKAAVLLLLYPNNDDLSTVFIKRNEYDGPHSGQISLPGGQFEKDDKLLHNTALRETAEELGIDTKNVEILGKLTNLKIAVSNYIVAPYVGKVDVKPDFDPDPAEVQYVIEYSLCKLIPPTIVQNKKIEIQGNTITIPYFNCNGNHIWGATAMILSEFIVLLQNEKLLEVL